MDQRIRVYELDRGCRCIHCIGIGTGELAARVREERPHPLSAIEHRVAHRATQWLGIEVRGREHPREDVLDPSLVLGGPVGP